MRNIQWALAGAVALGVLGGPLHVHAQLTNSASEGLLNPFAEPAPSIIDCADSPFGNAAPVVRDLEPLYLLNTTTNKQFEEWRPSLPGEESPLQQVYATFIDIPALSGKTMRKAINVDLNGDGRDEVVIASSNGSNVILTVYERSLGLSPTPQLIDTWTFTETEGGAATIDPASIDMVAGELDGSGDKQQEIAVSWHISSGAHNTDTRVVVLKGDSNGRIAQADNATAGNWRAGYSSTLPRLAVGDFLLTGRDQLVLVNYAEVNTYSALHYDLIELNDGSHGTAPTPTLTPGLGTNMYSKHFWNDLKRSANGTPVSYFATDDNNGIYMLQGGTKGLEVAGGDVVDSAAAELVVHLMFKSIASNMLNEHEDVVGQRLLHFDTARDANNVITDVILGNPGGGDAGQSYDSSRLLDVYPVSTSPLSTARAPAFSATVVDVDALLGKEILTVRAGRGPDDSALVDQGHLTWRAQKVQVWLAAKFQYQRGNNRTVKFTNTSHGPRGLRYDWDFGDGSAHSGEINPSHTYAGNGSQTFTVSLKVSDTSGPNQQGAKTYQQTVTVNGSVDNVPQGGPPPPWAYRIDPVPTYSVTHPSGLYSSQSLVKIAVGDMNRDGVPEVFAVAKDIGNTIHRHVFQRKADGSFDNAMATSTGPGVNQLNLVLADFDGDSVSAVLSTDPGACQNLTKKQMRALVWMPPYFQALQENAARSASYGTIADGSAQSEQRTGSYFAHNFSATFGVDIEINAPVVAVPIAEFELTTTFSYGIQSAKGSTHGYETGYSIDQGVSVNGLKHEGVARYEENTADCYTYDVVSSSGKVPDSTLSVCAPVSDGTFQNGANAFGLNILEDETVPIKVPDTWIPMQRDWASLTLFHAPSAGSAQGRGSVGFSEGAGADKATDGLFTTAAQSDQAYDKPYLEIDLGEPRDIMAVRVFPEADPQIDAPPFGVQPITFKKAAADMHGYRLYASATPFASDTTTPTNATSNTFVPGGVSTFVQKFSEGVYTTWNVWTGNPGSFAGDPNARTPLRARYLRLQKPGSGKIRIAEIQVFGDTHAEPPTYPQGVCDETVGDGLFKALVYDPVNRIARTIEVRGDMIWTGVVDGALGSDVPGCKNDSTRTLGSFEVVDQFPIWATEAIGEGDATHNWNLTQSSSTSQGSYTSIDHNFNVAIEASVTAGSVVVGAGYEVGRGITQEHATSMAWGTGLSVTGVIDGFLGRANCKYYPRPYSFKESEYSNTGMEHAMYVTDYVVRQPTEGTPRPWQRGNVPPECLGIIGDGIFANGFE